MANCNHQESIWKRRIYFFHKFSERSLYFLLLYSTKDDLLLYCSNSSSHDLQEAQRNESMASSLSINNSQTVDRRVCLLHPTSLKTSIFRGIARGNGMVPTILVYTLWEQHQRQIVVLFAYLLKFCPVFKTFSVQICRCVLKFCPFFKQCSIQICRCVLKFFQLDKISIRNCVFASCVFA